MADVGRPTVMTPIVIAKLEEAFALGCTDLEACLFAGISKDSLYRHQTDNADFCDRKELLKENPILVARTSVLAEMKGNGDLALKYLERKKKDEFSTRAELEHAHTFTQMSTIKVGAAEIKFNVGEEK